MGGSTKDLGALSGSHASHEAPAGLRPTGFDPARITGGLNGLRDLLCNLASLCDAWRAGEPETWTAWDQEQRERITECLVAIDAMREALLASTIRLFPEDKLNIVELAVGSRHEAEIIFEGLGAIATEAEAKDRNDG